MTKNNPDIDKCPENAYCVDTIGSYECQCFDGYTDVGSGFAFNCENIDECDMEAHRNCCERQLLTFQSNLIISN